MKRFYIALCVTDEGASLSSVRLNGMLWERVTADQQAAEIRQIWPSTSSQLK